ncbi:MAG: hypothetical protein AB7O96_07585 [Pseudobdellovibrionaceae bacterium]
MKTFCFLGFILLASISNAATTLVLNDLGTGKKQLQTVDHVRTIGNAVSIVSSSYLTETKKGPQSSCLISAKVAQEAGFTPGELMLLLASDLRRTKEDINLGRNLVTVECNYKSLQDNEGTGLMSISVTLLPF